MHFMSMTIFVILHCSAFASPAVPMQRNLLQFSNMINYKGYSSSDYNGYGCWCGAGTHGSKVFDATDNCCRIHDLCYDQIDGGLFGCSPKIVTYGWQKLSNGGIVCKDNVGSCDRKTCECDKAAADCFARHRSTYDTRKRNAGSSAICS